MNSADRRKPKYARVHADQNMIWSGRSKSNALKIVSMWESVIGSRCGDGVPWDRLIPRKTCCSLRQFGSGSDKPLSICSARTAER